MKVLFANDFLPAGSDLKLIFEADSVQVPRVIGFPVDKVAAMFQGAKEVIKDGAIAVKKKE